MEHGAVELNNQTVSYTVSISVVKAGGRGGRGVLPYILDRCVP